MLDVIYGYQSILDNIDTYIENSKFKKEYFIERLKISRATFYNKIKKKNFTINEMVVLSTVLFPEEAKIHEINEALKISREDSKAGRVKSHESVMSDIRKKLRA